MFHIHIAFLTSYFDEESDAIFSQDSAYMNKDTHARSDLRADCGHMCVDHVTSGNHDEWVWVNRWLLAFVMSNVDIQW